MTSYRLVERGRAEADVQDILAYYVHEGVPRIAQRFLLKIREAYVALADNPFVGSVYSSRHRQLQSVRQWKVKTFRNHVIYYQVLETVGIVRILRVLHGARDSELLFTDDDLA